MSGHGVICGGCYLVDRTKIISHWPEEETLAVIHEETVQGGGPGMNLGVNLKRLGGAFPVIAMGLTGEDGEGRYIREVLARYGVDAKHLAVTDKARTSYTDAMTSRKTGKRTFFHSQGANALLAPEHFLLEQTGAAFLHLGAPGIHDSMDAVSEDGENGWVEVLRRGRKLGMWTNLECISLPADELSRLTRPCLPYLDSIVINDFEAGALTGVKTVEAGETNVEAVKEAAAKLLGLGVKKLAAAHFPMGCVIARPGEAPVFSPSVQAPPEAIVSSVGAGDAFASGLIFGLLSDWPIERATRLAHAAAASCLTSLSTNEAIGTAEQCLALAEKWGFRQAPGY